MAPNKYLLLRITGSWTDPGTSLFLWWLRTISDGLDAIPIGFSGRCVIWLPPPTDER